MHGDDGFEPIEVTERPEPDAGDVVFAVIEEGEDGFVHPIGDEDGDEPDSRKDADASLTGACCRNASKNWSQPPVLARDENLNAVFAKGASPTMERRLK
mgnify:CR=1 FL=1